MKKLLLVTLFGLLVASFLSAQDDARPVSPLVASYGVSIGIFPAPSSADPWAELIQVAQSLASLRGGVEAQLTVPLQPYVWVGGGLGIHALSVGDGSSQTVFLDVPVRTVFKLGVDTSYAEVFGGFYASVLPWASTTPLGGPELGVRLALDGWYFEASLVVGSSLWSRYGLGFLAPLL